MAHQMSGPLTPPSAKQEVCDRFSGSLIMLMRGGD